MTKTPENFVKNFIREGIIENFRNYDFTKKKSINNEENKKKKKEKKDKKKKKKKKNNKKDI